MSDFRSEQGYLRACTQASCFARIIRWCKWWYVLLLFPSLTFLSVWCRLYLGTRKRSPWKSPSTPNTQEIRTRIYLPLTIPFKKFSSLFLFRTCLIATCCFLSFFLRHWRVSWWNQPKSAEFVFFSFLFVFWADGGLHNGREMTSWTILLLWGSTQKPSPNFPIWKQPVSEYNLLPLQPSSQFTISSTTNR